MKKIWLLFLVLSKFGFAQNSTENFVGTYTDHKKYPSTILKLSEDSFFYLQELDPIFILSGERFQNVGSWIANGNEVILNPDKEPRKKIVTFREKELENFDSFSLKINYNVIEYENEELNRTFEFYGGLYFVIVEDKILEISGNQSNFYGTKSSLKLDSLNTIKIKNKKIEEIRSLGIYTHELNKIFSVEFTNPNTNFVEVNISIEVDKERTPRTKKVLIKGNKALIEDFSGEIDNSIFANKLKKRNK